MVAGTWNRLFDNQLGECTLARDLPKLILKQNTWSKKTSSQIKFLVIVCCDLEFFVY